MSAKKSAAKASRIGALSFTLVALVLSIITAVLLSKMIGGTRYANEELASVVVAKLDIPASKRLNDDMLKVVQWPKSSIPDGAYSALDQLLGIKARVPVGKIYKGEPILKQRLSAPGQGTGMASLVPANYRGFPVPVDRWIADARLVYPGASVDVMTTINNKVDRRTYTKLVLQRVPVLAVDGKVDVDQMVDDGKKKNRVGKSVVTLLVTPEQGEILALASREGKVDLLLRNTRDEGVVETLGIDPLDLLGQADPEDVEEAEAALAAAKAAALAAEQEPERAVRRRRRPRRRLRTKRGERKAKSESGVNTGGTKVIDLGGN